MKKWISIWILLIATSALGQTHNFWTKKNDFGGLKRERAVAFVVDSLAFVGTGVDTAENVLNDFWKYNVENDAWEQVADLPGSVRRNAVAFTINGKGYVGTGMDSVAASSAGSQTLSDFWSYDPTLNSWTQKMDFPGSNGTGIYFSTAFSIDSKGYICGGKRGPNDYTDELWEYKPSVDQCAQLQDFPGGVRYQLSSFSIGYQGYVGLGTDQDYYRNDIWMFDATTNQWTQKADFPASERASSMTFNIGQRGYICMGANGGLLDDLWEYNPEYDQWSLKASYGGSARKNAVAFTVNNKAYVGTGKGYSGKKASMYEYTPSDFLSIQEENSIQLNLYPNPASEVLHIDSEIKMKNIQIINSSGRMILNTTKKNIPINHLKNGVYHVKIELENSIIKTEKFLKI